MAKQLSRAEQEKRWQAESDAHVITRYTEVVSDASRLKAAQGILEENAATTAAALHATATNTAMNAIIRSQTNKGV